MELSHNHIAWYQKSLGMPILALWIIVAALHHYIIPISNTAQIILFSLSVLLAGIPHGALDHLVEEKNLTLRSKKFSFIRFLWIYLLKMAIFGTLWYFLPLTSLCVFLLFSAYHFGETDLSSLKPKKTLLPLFSLSYGMLILVCLLLFHLEEVVPILSHLPGNNINIWLEPLEQNKFFILLTSAVFTLLTGFVYFSNTKNNPEQISLIVAQLALIIVIIVSLPLILGFTFYFGWWHSLHSLENIRIHLSGNNATISWQAMMKKSMPFSFAAFCFMLALLLWAGMTSNMPIILLSFFIGIAVLTAPHLDIMSRMYKARS